MALSRSQVIDAAVGILGRYGLADLSMRRLARELEVAPGALYWHVSGKQELLVEVADALLSEIPVPSADQPPEEAVVSLSLAVRGAVLRVPDGAEVVALAYAVEPKAAGPLRELSRQLGRLGLVGQEREAAADLLVHHVLGSVTTEQNQGTAARLDPDFSARSPAAATKSFEGGLSVILRGLGVGRNG
ncbi:MAG: TetR family transcriptional regulator [Terracoccus sp.]